MLLWPNYCHCWTTYPASSCWWTTSANQLVDSSWNRMGFTQLWIMWQGYRHINPAKLVELRDVGIEQEESLGGKHCTTIKTVRLTLQLPDVESLLSQWLRSNVDFWQKSIQFSKVWIIDLKWVLWNNCRVFCLASLHFFLCIDEKTAGFCAK